MNINDIYGLFSYNTILYHQLTDEGQISEINRWVLKIEKMHLEGRLLAVENAYIGIDKIKDNSSIYVYSESITEDLRWQLTRAHVNMDNELL